MILKNFPMKPNYVINICLSASAYKTFYGISDDFYIAYSLQKFEAYDSKGTVVAGDKNKEVSVIPPNSSTPQRVF